jgi:hypothetical protein
MKMMRKKIKKDMKEVKAAENAKFMNLMMMSMMMTNYNSMVTPNYRIENRKKSKLDEKYTPTSIL